MAYSHCHSFTLSHCQYNALYIHGDIVSQILNLLPIVTRNTLCWHQYCTWSDSQMWYTEMPVCSLSDYFSLLDPFAAFSAFLGSWKIAFLVPCPGLFGLLNFRKSDGLSRKWRQRKLRLEWIWAVRGVWCRSGWIYNLVSLYLSCTWERNIFYV